MEVDQSISGGSFMNTGEGGISPYHLSRVYEEFDTTKADGVQAKAGINAKGDLQVGAYNDRLDLTCRITELTPWEKKAVSTNQ